ncbi:MAG: enoyl-CoA hydratase-related protein, partial [Planctomycetota bacterium]|nr:enoyl-CoA hydratase-related protein [Planctomycetota bacterium]
AVSAGFCHEVVSHENLLWARAQEMAEEMAQNSPQAMLMTKSLINETIGEELFSHLNNGTATSAAARTTESAKEGVPAFAAQRKPDWK